jgi:hypothetical protein
MVFNHLSDIKAKNLANNKGRKTADNCQISVNENQRNRPQTQQVIRPSSEKEEETIGGFLKYESLTEKREKTGKEKRISRNKVFSVAEVLRADEVGLLSCSPEEEIAFLQVLSDEEDQGFNQFVK